MSPMAVAVGCYGCPLGLGVLTIDWEAIGLGKETSMSIFEAKTSRME